MTINQPPLNPDGVLAAKEAMRRVLELDSNEARTLAWEAIAPADYPDAVTKPVVTAYLAVAQPVVNSVEELDALPVGTVVIINGAMLQADDRDDYGTMSSRVRDIDAYPSEALALPARVLSRPEVNDA